MELMGTVLELPSKVVECLAKKSRELDVSLEDLAIEAILSHFEIDDPEVIWEVHTKLSEKYLTEGEELLRRGDYVQSSEKFWGAASQALKAVAAKRGERLRSHRELHGFLAKLVEETGDTELRRLWQSAGMLHQNFYENWLPPSMVKGNVEDVKTFVKKLMAL